MFNDELTLRSYEVVPDEIGNQREEYKDLTILCEIRSATRNEFYNYGDAELRPEYVAVINDCEYNGQTEALFRGEQYVITRTYQDGRDLIELTLSRRIQR